MSTTINLIKKTYNVAHELRAASDRKLKQVLNGLADELVAQMPALLRANKKDVALQDPENPRVDRLRLNEERVLAIAAAIRKIAKLPNPAGRVLEERVLPNKLRLQKLAVPLGVVGAVYESRPNVTFDIAALCLRSGNACVLKGSSEAAHTNKVAVKLIQSVLVKNGLPGELVTLLPSPRETVKDLFTATKYVDVLIPRGSAGLIEFVRKNSLVPVIETGAGVCHVYVEKKADPKKAVDIVVNAKTSRPSVCNAMDALLIDKKIAPVVLPALLPGFSQFNVEVFADKAAFDILKGYPLLRKASPEDFDREFQDFKCAIKVTDGLPDALDHIRAHSTKHSEAIVTEDKKVAEKFIQEVDAAAVYHNASTRFTDGEEFGLGAEIGISTQKLHARGPFALEKLVTEKWIVRGAGQIR